MSDNQTTQERNPNLVLVTGLGGITVNTLKSKQEIRFSALDPGKSFSLN